jgi:hypothetical protein
MSRGFSRQDAQKIIRELSHEGSVVPTWHVYGKRGPGRNFDMPDALNVVREGEAVSDPEYSQDFGNWMCKVTGEDRDGDPLTLVVAFDEDKGELFIITGY